MNYISVGLRLTHDTVQLGIYGNGDAELVAETSHTVDDLIKRISLLKEDGAKIIGKDINRAAVCVSDSLKLSAPTVALLVSLADIEVMFVMSDSNAVEFLKTASAYDVNDYPHPAICGAAYAAAVTKYGEVHSSRRRSVSAERRSVSEQGEVLRREEEASVSEGKAARVLVVLIRAR